MPEAQVEQPELFDSGAVRSLLDRLLSDSRLYKSGKDYKELLDFVVRLRNFAPFNAMLLQLQKPGLRYAASRRDWHERFGRGPKEDARPLIILWPFGPIGLIYDVIDTEGAELPEDVLAFFTHGSIDDEKLLSFIPLMRKKNIDWVYLDAGDTKAGSIRVIYRAQKPEEVSVYQMRVNKNHSTATQFVTLTHELAHLFLGHLGRDKRLNIPQRHPLSLMEREIEAESVAFLVSMRNGIRPKSQTYLSGYIDQTITIEHLDIYQIMRAAGQVETLLGLSAHTKFEKPEAPPLDLLKCERADLSFPASYFETRFKAEPPVTDWPKQFAIVSAYATTGEQWPDHVNKAADERLTKDLQASARWCHRVIGYSPITGHSEPGWAVETSFPEACDLGHRYHQDAIYYIEDDILLASHCEPRHRQLFQIAPSFRDRLEQ
jgi:Protein of unknown function (DUF3293)/IrrE N-terminal-like domain